MNINIPDKNLMIKAKLGNHAVKPTDHFILEIENTWPGIVKVDRVYQHHIAN